MTYLYVDSSNYLTIGTLKKDLSWNKYIQTENLKSSSKLHSMIYEMLKEEGKTLKDIVGIFLAAGPGSYTGIRLAEGLAQILEWQDYPIYSFYHFEVPSFLGHETGAWFSQAFKKEFFFYQWDGKEVQHRLLNKEQFELELKSSSTTFSHYPGLLDGEFTYTSELIHNNSEVFFSKVKERAIHLEPFYFRTLEQEFTVPKSVL
jgi:tRNA threonylcarbamoyladenosine biosynthesis protein TsaB